MQTSIPTTVTRLYRWTRQGLCQQHTRFVSRYAEATALHSSRPSVDLQPTFESTGIRAPIVSALHTAFPNIKYPTRAQSEFIPAILSGKDVLLKDATGTGKSFGVVLALLNKARKRAVPTWEGVVSVKPFITSLVIVPHRDLAYQFHHWIDRLVKSSATPGHAPPSLASIAQVIVRGGEIPIASQQEAILAEPPHILIGTPQALLELLDNVSISHKQLQTISSVYVDEIDYMVESIPSRAGKYSKQKAKRRMERHPGAANQVLDLVFASRRKKWEEKADSCASQVSSSDGQQLIVSSATLRSHLSHRLCSGGGWINIGTMTKISGDGQPAFRTSSGKVSHCVLIVSNDGEIRNIDGAQEAIPARVEGDRELITADQILDAPDVEIELDGEEVHQKYLMTELTINQNALDAVAAAFALDVPSVALLSLPASAPIQRVVHELRGLGVNAHSLDLLVANRGRTHLLQGATEVSEENPVMLVSTVATTRGLDLPELTHVFILGIPRGRRADTYLHIAGRVGRFGREGKVITIVEEREEERKEDGTLARARDEPKRMMTLLREIGIVPTQFEHFD